MSKAIVTFKIMPENPEVDLVAIKEKSLGFCTEAGSIGEMQTQEEPVAFGLKALKVLAMFEVEGGDFDSIAAKMQELEGVQTAEVFKMDLALG